MFESISFAGLSKSHLFKYAAELAFFKSHKGVKFKPGLTVLFGPNGCGKTTLLRMLGETMCATQGGTSIVTESSLRGTVESDFRKKKATDAIGLKVTHDGQPVMYCDPRQTVGILGGGFDDDFFNQGLAETMSGGRSSHGQNSLRRLNSTLAVLVGKANPPDKVEWRVNRRNLNDVWAEKIDVLESRMAATIPAGQVTILLDEPEANLSLKWQNGLWKQLGNPKMTEKFQIIVASHSVFSLGIEHANYVEFEEGYVEHATEALREKAVSILAAKI